LSIKLSSREFQKLKLKMLLLYNSSNLLLSLWEQTIFHQKKIHLLSNLEQNQHEKTIDLVPTSVQIIVPKFSKNTTFYLQFTIFLG
jgi:hypothetical protein